jgi:nitroreductase
MNVVEAIKTRKSIRDFKSDPVSQNILKKILKIACRAPSASNAQPWQFTVITGDVLENIRMATIEKLQAGQPFSPEWKVDQWPPGSVYRRRQVEIAKQLFKLMEIAREDQQKRTEWIERGFRYFNAPAVIIITSDGSLPETRPLLDIGGVMQTICLAALEFGLGTCIQNQGVMYPDILRKFTQIPASQRIIVAIAMGYPNWDFAANQVASAREALENITTWCGF